LRWIEDHVRRRVLSVPSSGAEAVLRGEEAIERSRRRQEAQAARLRAIDTAGRVMRRDPGESG
jgi:hypothetical protein